jgi:hypothetical protein
MTQEGIGKRIGAKRRMRSRLSHRALISLLVALGEMMGLVLRAQDQEVRVRGKVLILTLTS